MKTELTDLERRIIDCVADGKCSKQIAAKFRVSISTIEHERCNIRYKLEEEFGLEHAGVEVFTHYAIARGIIDQKHADVAGRLSLTSAEDNILRHIGECLTYKEIAGEENVSHRTVEKHRERICLKIRLLTGLPFVGKVELVHIAIARKLVTLKFVPVEAVA